MDMQFSQGKQDDLGRNGLDRPSVQGRMARFMEPCILLLLTAERSHGYELMEKLRHFGFDGTSSDMATLYRTLRQLEEDNMVVSAWEEGSQGPPKRVYELTEDGHALLREWIAVVSDNRHRLTRLIDAYGSACRDHADLAADLVTEPDAEPDTEPDTEPAAYTDTNGGMNE